MQEQNFPMFKFYSMLTNDSIYPNAFASITFIMADYFKHRGIRFHFLMASIWVLYMCMAVKLTFLIWHTFLSAALFVPVMVVGGRRGKFKIMLL